MIAVRPHRWSEETDGATMVRLKLRAPSLGGMQRQGPNERDPARLRSLGPSGLCLVGAHRPQGGCLCGAHGPPYCRQPWVSESKAGLTGVDAWADAHGCTGSHRPRQPWRRGSPSREEGPPHSSGDSRERPDRTDVRPGIREGPRRVDMASTPSFDRLTV